MGGGGGGTKWREGANRAKVSDGKKTAESRRTITQCSGVHNDGKYGSSRFHLHDFSISSVSLDRTGMCTRWAQCAPTLVERGTDKKANSMENPKPGARRIKISSHWEMVEEGVRGEGRGGGGFVCPAL